MNTILIILYIFIATIHESIYLYSECKNIQKKFATNRGWQMFKELFTSSANIKQLKRKVWNWYTITFIIIPLFIIISSLMFPFSLISIIKKNIFGKSKLEKEAEEETARWEDAEKKSEEWLKNEGDIMPTDHPDITIEIK